MSEKSLAISCVAAAIVCGTFFYPDPPVAANARAQPVQGKTVAATEPVKTQFSSTDKVAMSHLDAPAIANNVAKAAHAATPSTRDWGNRIAIVSK